jgi:hypothetical protein
MKLCTPLVIYIVLAGLGLGAQLYHALTGEPVSVHIMGRRVTHKHVTFGGLLVDLVFTALVACFLNFLCIKRYVGVAWAFIVLKLFLTVLVVLLVLSLLMNMRQHHRQHRHREKMADYPGALSAHVNPESIPRNVTVHDRGVDYTQIQQPGGRVESIGQAMFDLQMSGR